MADDDSGITEVLVFPSGGTGDYHENPQSG
jgi:hypothetical protein